MNRLKQVLDEKGITAYRLSKDLKIRYEMISNYKTGKNDPSVTRAIQIANYLNLPVEEIWTSKEH